MSQSAAEADDGDDSKDDSGENTAAVARLVPILGSLSDGYSGADIKMLCRDAAMAPMRRAIAGKSPDDIRRMKESGEVCLVARNHTVMGSHTARLASSLQQPVPMPLIRFVRWLCLHVAAGVFEAELG